VHLFWKNPAYSVRSPRKSAMRIKQQAYIWHF